jgi:hypothetical protein
MRSDPWASQKPLSDSSCACLRKTGAAFIEFGRAPQREEYALEMSPEIREIVAAWKRCLRIIRLGQPQTWNLGRAAG